MQDGDRRCAQRWIGAESLQVGSLAGLVPASAPRASIVGSRRHHRPIRGPGRRCCRYFGL